MIELTHGNLLQSDAEVLVNTVNCVGVMGKGIALQFKQAFPANFEAYKAACDAGEVAPGRVFTVETGLLTGPKYIINFPTKRHWRGRSKLDDIRAGLEALVVEVRRLGVASVAVPPLGCGQGGLKWEVVQPLIEAAFAATPEIRIQLYPPQPGPRPEERPVRTERPKWTRARALFVKLMDLYRASDYALSLLEIQKLAYFLQAAGEPLRLRYEKHHYGPYADNLNHVLQVMDGHFVHGALDRKPESIVHVVPTAVKEAESFLDSDAEAQTRLEAVASLIEGFENPYGMELLATVHWAAAEDSASSADEVVEAVQAWSVKKRRRFPPKHILRVHQHLDKAGWLSRSAINSP